LAELSRSPVGLAGELEMLNYAWKNTRWAGVEYSPKDFPVGILGKHTDREK